MMKVKDLVVKLLIDGVKATTVYPVNSLLVYFIEHITEQEKQLSSLEQHVKITPFKRGKVFLEEAQSASSFEEQRYFINEALKLFIEVSETELPSYPLLPIQACLNVGLCLEFLFKKDRAIHWYKKTYERLTESYPKEMDFLERYENKLQEFESKKSVFNKDVKAYAKKKKAYEQQLQKYNEEMRQYQEMVRSLSFINENDKGRIRTFILKVVEAEESSISNLLNTSYSFQNKRLDPNIFQRPSLRSASSQNRPTLPRRTINPQFDFSKPDLYRKPLRTPLTPSYSSGINSTGRLIRFQTNQNELQEDILLLYKILGISRDARKDYPYIVSIIEKGQTYLPTSGTNLGLSKRFSGLLDHKTSIRPLATLRQILSNNKTLLGLVQPSPPPAMPEAPAMPEKPDDPGNIEILLSTYESEDDRGNDESILSIFWGIFKSGSQLSKEATFFAKDLSELLQVKR